MSAYSKCAAEAPSIQTDAVQQTERFLCALWVATRRAALPCTEGLGEHVLYSIEAAGDCKAGPKA